MPAKTLFAWILILAPFSSAAQPPAPQGHLRVHLIQDSTGVKVINLTPVESDLPKHRGSFNLPDPAVLRGEFHNPHDPRKIDSVRIRRTEQVHYTIRLPLDDLAGLDYRPSSQSARQASYEVDILQDMGDPANRVDIVILGDGYRAEDQQKLTADVATFLQTFWSYASVGEYQNFFNIKLIHVISNENGADNGSYGADRDTALGAYYGCYGIDRLICLDDAAVYNIADSHAPEYDNLFVIVNDPKYGGAGGFISVFSVNADWGPLGEVAMHEYGHSMGDLADEYEDPYPGFPECIGDCPEPNATIKTSREEIKWKSWILDETPVPTPGTSSYWGVVGVFEGARYHPTGVYRPKYDCLMRNFGIGFCEVCAEAMVLSFYDRVSPIDGATPSSPIQLTGCEEVQLSVNYPVPQPNSMRFSWSLDDQVVDTGPNPSYLLKSSALGDGNFQVSVEVFDSTLLVRSDPYGLLTAERSWTVSVSDAGQGACIIDGECYVDQTLNPENRCQICLIAQNSQGWTDDDSKACDDLDPCTANDVCSGGVCAGTEVPGCCVDDQQCDDGISCTQDECDLGVHECSNLLTATSCLIDGACHQNGAKNPEDSCLICNSAENQSSWTKVDNCPKGCGCMATGSRSWGGLLILLLAGLVSRRRRG